MKRLLLALLFTGTLAQAGDATVLVKGMVCSFCSQGLNKRFKSEPAVEALDVNLDEKYVKVKFKAGQDLSDERIRELVTEAGFNVDKIVRE